MIVCIPVTEADEVGGSWGRAPRVALADVQDGQIIRWEAFDVAWDALHDTGTEGGHHARVATFLQQHGVQVVVAHHIGPPMVQMLEKMGIALRSTAGGDARRAVLAAAGTVTG